MLIRLNKSQRRIAIGAAVAVAILLAYQADAVGLDETPWLLGVLVIAALLAAAVSGNSDKPAKPITMPLAAKRERTPAQMQAAAYTLYESEFMQLNDRVNEPFVPNATTLMIGDHVRIQAAKFAWMSALLQLERQHPGFRKAEGYHAFRLVGAGKIKNLYKSTALELEQPANDSSMKVAVKEMVECKIAFDRSYKAMAESATYPMNSIFQVIEMQFPFASVTNSKIDDHEERLAETYGPLLRRAISAMEA